MASSQSMTLTPLKSKGFGFAAGCELSPFFDKSFDDILDKSDSDFFSVFEGEFIADAPAEEDEAFLLEEAPDDALDDTPDDAPATENEALLLEDISNVIWFIESSFFENRQGGS